MDSIWGKVRISDVRMERPNSHGRECVKRKKIVWEVN